MTANSFDDYVASLSAVAVVAAATEPEALGLCQRATDTLSALQIIDREHLAEAIAKDPEILPVLAAAAGLSRERFRGWLKVRFGTAGWLTLGRVNATDLVAALDDDLDLVGVLAAQSARDWTWADVLARTMAPQQAAARSIQQGRALEDEVEAVVSKVGLPFVPRTRFVGTADQSAPADFAIPAGGDEAAIAVAVKGFDSTGSKLTDASREIEEMAAKRRPSQYIFAVVDGQGWLRRQNDLRRIHALWVARQIDGLYGRSSLDAFEVALRAAGQRLDLV